METGFHQSFDNSDSETITPKPRNQPCWRLTPPGWTGLPVTRLYMGEAFLGSGCIHHFHRQRSRVHRCHTQR